MTHFRVTADAGDIFGSLIGTIGEFGVGAHFEQERCAIQMTVESGEVECCVATPIADREKELFVTIGRLEQLLKHLDVSAN